MEPNQVIEITQEEALKAVTEFDSAEIHCFRGFIGADWKKEKVVELIKQTNRIAWAYHMIKHNLAVINEGKLYAFGIPYPQEAENDT